MTAAKSAGLPPSTIIRLLVGIAASLLATSLVLLWLDHRVTHGALAAFVLRTVWTDCRDQNPTRTRRKWGALS
jgi:hypothetical protein